MTKRYLLLTHDFPPQKGGVARYLGNLVSYYHDAIDVVHDDKRLFYRFLWPHWMKSVFLVSRKRKDFEVLFVSHILPFGLVGLFARIFLNKSYVLIVHGFDFMLAGRNPWKRFLRWLVTHHARLLVTNSEYLSEEIQSYCKHEMPVLCVYPSLASAEPVPHLYEKGDSLHIITISRLVSRKGHLRVLDALARLKSKGIPFQYRIVGFGPLAAAIRDQIEARDLSKDVEMSLDVPDEALGNHYRWADVFVMPVVNDPVDREGFGMVFLEAARYGVPSISTDLPGIDEAILKNETGILLPDGDVEALANVLIDLYEHPEKRETLGKTAQAFAPSFSVKKQFDKLALYV
jgi:glycosyltransferase involved in cell wall biosynthesis